MNFMLRRRLFLQLMRLLDMESIILNVLSATVVFPTCESVRMSQKVDKTGERTIVVVRKLEKVTSNDVNIGLGYVCVRNKTRNTSYDEARSEKARLFQNHALLSKIDKSMVSVPVPANKLVQIQATILSKCLPDIVRKINDKLAVDVAAVNELAQHMSSVAEALATFMHIMSSATPKEFVVKLWIYIERVVIKVLMHHSCNYPQLQHFIGVRLLTINPCCSALSLDPAHSGSFGAPGCPFFLITPEEDITR
ncbi:Dynamin-related protein 4C [Capsicum baccatum]|uniref:Dynamin-related protein 4C n=1 Tax=Capsicum baccatum TaxID=33114 RepID=A0A2G2VQI5_CAPBA|nr:Dynamin-related protein 4C [Capsicum baccatum]